MYSPPYNRIEERTELLQFLRANSFPVIITRGLQASHLPATVHEEGTQVVVDMHMARANRQWQAFDGTEVLIIFTGPHAYISPRWYEDKERVPTWNYTAVHLYGMPEIVDERGAKHAGMRQLVSMMDPQWLAQFDALSREYVDRMLGGIVNFRIPVTRIETRWKLSQNRGRREMELIAAELQKQGETALAELTLKHLVK
jgi:transcriptional regulator